MPERKLGVLIHGARWVSTQHIKAFDTNPHTEVVAISSRKLSSCQARAEEAGLEGIELYDIHTGRINSKRAGAEWIKAKLDASWNDLIGRSWSGRPSPEISSRKPAHPDELRLTIDFIRYMMAQIKEKRDAQQGAPPR